MGIPTCGEVAEFLREFKYAAIGPPKKLSIWGGLKNVPALLDLGINRKIRDEILLGLMPEDYCEGPMEDDNPDREGQVWVFGKTVNGQEVYIKLKVVEIEPFNQAVCLSFHPAEHPMSYPFRR